MLCQRCQAAWSGSDGRCPQCDDPWRTTAPEQPPSPYTSPAQGYGRRTYDRPGDGQGEYGQEEYGRPGHPQGDHGGNQGYGGPTPVPPAGSAPYQGYQPPPPPPGYGPAPGTGTGYAPVPASSGHPAMPPAPASPPAPARGGLGSPLPGAGGDARVRVPGALSTALYVLLGLCAITDLLGLVAAALEFSLFGRLDTDPDGVQLSEADAVDAFYGVTAVGGLMLLIATGIVFLVWFHRVRVNAELISFTCRQRYSPAMAVGSWFIPFVNLWLPKQAADDIWKASDPGARAGGSGDHPQGRARSGSPVLVLAWWLTWTGANLVATAARFVDAGTDVFDYSGMRDVYGVEMAAGAMSVVAAVLAVLVVRKITTMQAVRHAMGAAGGPPSGRPGGAPGWGHPR